MKLKVFFPKDWSGNEESLCSPDGDPFLTAMGKPGSLAETWAGCHRSAFSGARWLHSSRVATAHFSWSSLCAEHTMPSPQSSSGTEEKLRHRGTLTCQRPILSGRVRTWPPSLFLSLPGAPASQLSPKVTSEMTSDI